MKSLQRDAGRGKVERVEGRDSLRRFEDALQQRQLRALRQIKVRQLNLTLDTREREREMRAQVPQKVAKAAAVFSLFGILKTILSGELVESRYK